MQRSDSVAYDVRTTDGTEDQNELSARRPDKVVRKEPALHQLSPRQGIQRHHL